MSKYWTNQINPVSGCTPASEACANCYARDLHERFRAAEKPVEFYSKPFGEVTLHPEQLKKFDQIARMKESQVVFVGNMCDLFHEDVPDEYILNVFRKIHSDKYRWLNSGGKLKPNTFIILTKRAQRMRDFITSQWAYLEDENRSFAREFPTLWLGVTAENQQRANERIPMLLDTPAAHRWVSVEPMLGPITLAAPWVDNARYGNHLGMRSGGIDLIIAGGESGRRARPSKRDWFIDLHHQCIAACTRFYLKQWGDAYEDKQSVMRDSARFFEPEAFEQPFIGKVSS
jgi:protein gp37